MKQNENNKPGTSFSFIPELEKILNEVNGVEDILEQSLENSDIISRYADKGAFESAIRMRDDLVISFLKDKSSTVSTKSKLKSENESLSLKNQMPSQVTDSKNISVVDTAKPLRTHPTPIPEVVDKTSQAPSTTMEHTSPLTSLREQSSKMPIVEEKTGSIPTFATQDNEEDEYDYQPNRIRQVISFLVYLGMLVSSVYLFITQIL